jgi:hypothetical protein
MALNQTSSFGVPSLDVRSFTLSAMVAGKAPAVALPSGFSLDKSQILGFSRITSGGTVGTPFLAVVGTATSGNPAADAINLYFRSTNVADTSVYKVFFHNVETSPQIKSALALL